MGGRRGHHAFWLRLPTKEAVSAFRLAERPEYMAHGSAGDGPYDVYVFFHGKRSLARLGQFWHLEVCEPAPAAPAHYRNRLIADGLVENGTLPQSVTGENIRHTAMAMRSGLTLEEAERNDAHAATIARYGAFFYGFAEEIRHTSVPSES